jgi:hypothetical protein
VVYLIRILRNVRDISDTAKREANALASDVEELRSNLKNKKGSFSSILSLINFVKKRRDKKGR